MHVHTYVMVLTLPHLLPLLHVSTPTHRLFSCTPAGRARSGCMHSHTHKPAVLGETDPLTELGRGAVKQWLPSSKLAPHHLFLLSPWYPRRQPQPDPRSLSAAGVVLDPARPGLLRLGAHHHRELAAGSVPPHARRGRRPGGRACALTPALHPSSGLAPPASLPECGQGLSVSPYASARDRGAGDSTSVLVDRAARFTKIQCRQPS